MEDTTGGRTADVAVRTLGPFPPAVRSGYRALRRSLLGRAQGRVLDLGGLDAVLDAYPLDAVLSVTYLAQRRADRVGLLQEAHRVGLPLELATRVPTDGRFDTIVCTGRLASADDARALAFRLAGLLAPEGRLLVVEPSVGTGWEGHLGRVTAPWAKGAVGWDPTLDVPRLLRSTGLVVVDLDRPNLTTLALPMRTVVRAVARRRTAPKRPDSADAETPQEDR